MRLRPQPPSQLEALLGGFRDATLALDAAIDALTSSAFAMQAGAQRLATLAEQHDDLAQSVSECEPELGAALAELGRLLVAHAELAGRAFDGIGTLIRDGGRVADAASQLRTNLAGAGRTERH